MVHVTLKIALQDYRRTERQLHSCDGEAYIQLPAIALGMHIGPSQLLTICQLHVTGGGLVAYCIQRDAYDGMRQHRYFDNLDALKAACDLELSKASEKKSAWSWSPVEMQLIEARPIMPPSPPYEP